MANRTYEHMPELGQDEVKAVLPMIGNQLQMSGILFSGQGYSYLIMLPDNTFAPFTEALYPTPAEWTALLKQADETIIYQEDATGLMKPFIRKSQASISGGVQQQVWLRDGLKCMYCLRPMGEVVLTIDHWVPLELGGVNNPSNYLSACRRCNKDKGHMLPQDWCQQKGLNYDYYDRHLKHHGINL